MMNIKHYSIVGTFLITALMWSTTTTASLLGIYAGASAGKAEVLDSNPTEDDTGAKVYAGYRILGPLAVELSQVDLGTHYSGIVSIGGTSLDAVLFLPAGPVNVFAKAGYFAWKVEYAGGVSPEETGSSAKFGFGVEYNLFANIDFRLEWEQYDDIGDPPNPAEMTLISAGVNIAF